MARSPLPSASFALLRSFLSSPDSRMVYQTLANSANSIDYLPHGTDFTYEELTGMFSKYFEDGRAAIDCGDGYGTFARIRTIQVNPLRSVAMCIGSSPSDRGFPGRRTPRPTRPELGRPRKSRCFDPLRRGNDAYSSATRARQTRLGPKHHAKRSRSRFTSRT